MSEHNRNDSESVAGMLILNGAGKNDQKLQKRLNQLLRLQQLQKSIVKENMHNAMSPLSAISGYLELIDMTLEQDANVDQIEHYRRKIEVGISEVNEILQQLNAIYEEEQKQDLEEDSLLDVDLNWIVRDVCDQLNPDASKINFLPTDKPLHINTELYTIKLIMYKLISYAVKCSPNKKVVDLATSAKEKKANLTITFGLSDQKANDIIGILNCKTEKDENEYIKQGSLNEGLLASSKLMDQINGYLSFKMVEDYTGTFSVSLPLA